MAMVHIVRTVLGYIANIPRDTTWDWQFLKVGSLGQPEIIIIITEQN